MSEGSAVLVAHAGTELVTRAQLEALPEVIGTDTFRPVPHILLVRALEAVLMTKGITIRKEQFALRTSDGAKLFGTFDLSIDALGIGCGALGFRQALNKTMSIQIVAGMRVFVCDNMALSGDTLILKRRHTGGLDLLPELLGAINGYQDRFDRLLAEVTYLQSLAVTDDRAKAVIHDAFVLRDIMPMKYIGDVSNAYFEPSIPEFEPRTAWSLHNAFTGVMKGMYLNRRMEATQLLGGLFGMGNPNVSPKDEEEDIVVIPDADPGVLPELPV